MTDKKPLIALTGALFTVLGIVASIVYPAAPDFVDTPQKIAAFYNEESGSILATDALYLISGAAFLFFLGYLYSAGRRAEGGDGRLALTAFGAGVAGIAMMFAATSADLVAALRVEDRDSIDPVLASAHWDLNSILFGAAAPAAMAALVIAVAALSLKHGFIARWHGALSVVLGVALLIPLISHVAIIVFLFWILLTSVMLYAEEPAGE